MFFLRMFIVLLLLFISFPQFLSANNTAESQLRLVVLGDSLTAGYGLTETEAFPSQLEAALQRAGYSVKVINAGVSGDTRTAACCRS